MAFFICSNCGYGSASWLGRCPDCAQFNTFVSQPSMGPDSKGSKEGVKKMRLTPFKQIGRLKQNVPTKKQGRLKTGIFEFDRVLGGGIVPGEVILLSGEPGVGKSTLLLQSLFRLKTAYISGEEAAEQIKDRAQRLGVRLDNLFFSDDLQVEGIVEGIEDLSDTVEVVVIDSIQTIYSKSVNAPAGNISQLRECANQLTNLAKKLKIGLIIIGHITKGGEIAGPKTLEHLVDCVINFEGERVSNFRLLRASKNRFGPTDEVGIFEMTQKGLAEVTNPLVFLEQKDTQEVGKAVVGVVEGQRSLYFEIQTLVVPTILAFPRRVVKGLDYNKVLLLLAVIRKHLGLPLDKFDIYVNVIGGVDIRSTASDLGLVASLLSSLKNIPVPKKSLFIGEVGLLGEVRKTLFEDKIIKEARRLGFYRIFASGTLPNIKMLRTTLFR
ncbi:DNA repair protein RadA [Candidatus Roizmanbacteria bacterium]|nr:DNA repair protein RadA [Candidatus Roizmanbacteria bacterium]